MYEQARPLLDQSKYDRATERSTDVAAMNGARADAALYWKPGRRTRPDSAPKL